jgi:putative tryptophan/tyrosine transport system substrate-binding protein
MAMRRRDALALILAVCSSPVAAQTQQPGKVHRIAWLSSASYLGSPNWAAFIDAMRELGWVEGQNFSVDHLLYEGRLERLPALAAEAVQRNVDLIICAGTPPAMAAKNATTTIPILFFFVGDPVGAGLVASLSRPGGNITGLGGLGAGIYAKMLALLKEAAPKATRIALLLNPAHPLHAAFRADAESAAKGLKVSVIPVEQRTPDDLGRAFATIASEKLDALLILGQPFQFGQGARIAAMAIEQRLPAMIPFEEVARDGVLMAYGSRLIDDLRRLPHYVDRILKGAKPADLPVEQATRFYLTLNLQTAKAIGLTLPPSLLQRADQLIQ